MQKRIPVHIITGFLGAGKTTFLNHLIRSRLPERIVVIENEVGDTNIDGALVLEGANSVVELTAGCICYSLNDELFDILEGIAALRGINPLARCYVGTNGAFPVDEMLALETLQEEGVVAQTAAVEAGHKHLHHDITSFCLTFDRAFDLRELSRQMLVLLNIHRHQVYRVKGIIAHRGRLF